MLNKIICGNCLEIMKDIPDGLVDMILCDLPFGVTRNSWDNVIPFEPLWEQYKRITKPNSAIVLTATQPFASQLIMSNIDMFRYDMIWEKNKSTGFLNAKKMPLRNHEHILVFYRSLPIYNPQKTTGHKPANSYTKHTSDGPNYGKTKKELKGGGQTDRYPKSVLKIPVLNNDSEERRHPVQKPVKLCEYLINTFTNAGMVVLDNCAGAFTTAIACNNTNRKWICIEKEEKYCTLAEKYINKSWNLENF